MPLDIIVGTQWGDEGKGRVVDLLSAQADFVARYNGGDNAGHTVTVGEKTFRLHLIPSGMIHPGPVGVIGNGVVVNPQVLLGEIEALRQAGLEVSPYRLRLSHAAHLITPAHRALDAAQEAARGGGKIGTTLRGIGPAYASKTARRGLRMADMLEKEAFARALSAHVLEVNQALERLYAAGPLDPGAIVQEFEAYRQQLAPYVTDVSRLLAEALGRGRRVLAEGAQGTLLDLDHGTYPFVTSSNPTAAGALVGLGLGVGYTERVVGVTKAFQTRVGAGPLPTELEGEMASRLRGSGANPWDEFGTTTGRPRRVGWLDLVLLRYAVRVNGLTELALTKLDILTGLAPLRVCRAYRRNGETYQELPLGPGDLETFDPVYTELPGWDRDVRQARRWEDLPATARAYILFIEEECGVPVRLVSVGPERTQVVEMQ
ncbi:MAG TPA: adenylosuccinate synthase, partial [Anaerolineales bacterium]|nr:adenylosuccinate synthase [Anaerolineales bacterium]